jgi:hypothetical protein
MSGYIITGWFGRLGNNIQQLSNALYFCKENEIKFHSPPHPLIKPISINFGPSGKYSSRFFFHNGPQRDFFCDLEDLDRSRRELLQTYVVPNFTFDTSSKMPDDTLVIHLRGEDIFNNNPHRFYVQNPLSYYKTIIDQYDKTIVVTQGGSNPIIGALATDPRVKVQSSTVQEDFATLLSATNLSTSGVGTFAITAAICSPHLKNLHCTDLFLEEHINPEMFLYYNDVNVYMTKLSGYIPIGEWHNTSEQIKTMLTYEI